MWSCDFALFWPVGKPRQRGKGRDYHVAITSDMSTRPKGHPCPRPLDQMTFVTDCFSDGNDTVLDPRLGRRFIGCEIEERYFSIACRRIEEAQRQPDLFVPPPADDAYDRPMRDLFREAAD